MNKMFEYKLCVWYEENHRKLPWRESRNPYEIWISETMLQQTRVETVIPYYHRFLTAFPTVRDLADADEQRVLKFWEGLGYYSRARNLHTAAKEIVDLYGGVIPNDIKQVSKLKGFGPYTTGAVLSIAYNMRVPAVDGNVMRVMSRVEKCDSDIAKAKTKKEMEGLVNKHMQDCEPRVFNQALMELGATICLPKNPKCDICPVQKECLAYQENCVKRLPVKSKRKQRRRETRLVLYAWDDSKGTWVQQRGSKGLLANLYELTNFEIEVDVIKQIKNLEQNSVQPFHIVGEDGTQFEVQGYMTTFVHIFTHIEWELMVVHAKVLSTSRQTKGRFCTDEEMATLPFAAPFLKVMKMFPI